jgi:hypothetical protein
MMFVGDHVFTYGRSEKICSKDGDGDHEETEDIAVHNEDLKR